MNRLAYIIFAALLSGAPFLPASASAQVRLAQADTEKSDGDKSGEEKTAVKGETTEESAETAAEPDKKSEKVSSAAEGEEASKQASKGETAESSEDESTAKADAERVPLAANFSNIELATIGGVYVVGVGLLLAGPSIFDAPDTSIGTPQVGSLDYNVSSRFHGDLADPGSFLFGVPDFTGQWLLPIGASLFYLGSAGYYRGTDDTLFGQTVNIDHSAAGFFEAMGWTALLTGTVKHLIGRERPYKALDRPEFAEEGALEETDSNLSFFSGHTSTAFSIASYVAWDLSDHLVEKRGWGFWSGRFLPFASLYGLGTLIGLSRIYDQEHWASDVMMGALVGSLTGNLVYLTHFEPDGSPTVRNPEALGDVEVGLAPIVPIGGGQGIGLVGSF